MKAIILLSGGLDSLVVLHLASERKIDIETLTFDYNQSNKIEISHASKISSYYGVHWNLVRIDTSIFLRSSSSIVHKDKKLEQDRSVEEISRGKIPSTYVPGRNTLFLSYAVSLGESLFAQEIHIGANASDLAGFPDTRPSYFQAYQALIHSLYLENPEKAPQLVTPLLHCSKKEIVQIARLKKIPIELSISCYRPHNDSPCGVCDACTIRNDALHF